MSEKTKRVNKTKEELVGEVKMKQEQKAQAEQKQLIKDRMEALHKLEDELGCVFIPMIHYKDTGSQTYISPFDAPKTTKEGESVVE